MTEKAILSIVMSFLGALGFSGLFNIRGWRLWAGALGGMITWTVQVICSMFLSEAFATLAAGIVGALYAQVMARIGKSPATLFVVPAMIVMVPGGGLYLTMQYAIQGDWTGFLSKGTETVKVAVAIATAMMLVSSIGKGWEKLKD